jgi:hypothetical protein
MSGASRWLDAPAMVGTRPMTADAAKTPPAAKHAVARLRPDRLLVEPDM